MLQTELIDVMKDLVTDTEQAAEGASAWTTLNFPHSDPEKTMAQPTEPRELERRRQLWTSSESF